MSKTITSDPFIGQQLANFRLERVIGRGGMAKVYFGIDVKLNRPVAVKVIDARYRDNPAYAERFVREAQVVAGWRNPNIAQVYYADDSDGLYYFVMEYIDGLDLRQLMDMYRDDGQLMPDKDVINIGQAVAEALDYAHLQGVIHRDIKPSNVMVSYDNRVLLMDFGLALHVTEGSMGEVFGTPHYMAPEQARRSADAVPQSDLYALGVILFELLTGHVPFDDSSPTSVAIAHITQEPPLPRSLNPDLSAETEKVLLKALEKDPQERYQTGKELMDALTTALKRRPSSQAEQPELPPLPAAVEQMGSQGTRPMLPVKTVAERLALEIETRNLPPPTLADNLFARVSARRLIIGLLAALLFGAGLVWAGTQFDWWGNGEQTAVASASEEETAVPGLVEVAETPTLMPTPSKPPPLVATIAEPTEEAPTTVAETAVPTPSATPLPRATATPTPDPNLRLIYNQYGFYVLNISNRSLNLNGLSFVALADDGSVTSYAYQARDWPRTRTIQPDSCMGIEPDVDPTGRPESCRQSFNSLDFPGSTSPEVFWLLREDVSRFRVAYFGETIKTCIIADGFCTVALPE